MWQQRPIYVAKETYLCGKRDLLLMVHVLLFSGVDIIHMWQKRPIYVAKETYLCGKRGLFMWQKTSDGARPSVFCSAA